MKKLTLLLSLALLGMSCSKSAKNPEIIIETSLGNIVAEIFLDQAPITAPHFLSLVESGTFNEGAAFYRVTRPENQPNNAVKIDVIQGGLRGQRTSPISPVAHEITDSTGLKHLNGTLSMARAEPGSATCEFFICIGNQPELDYGGKRDPSGQGFSPFGKVTKGMDVVKKIQEQKEEKQYLVEPVKILSIKKVE